MTAPRPLVLLIDDNEVDREAVRRLVGRDFDFVEAGTAASGLDRARERTPDCVLLDYRLPDADGVDLVPGIAVLNLPIVMLSGQGSEAVAVAALKSGAHDYLPKDGLSADALRASVRRAIQIVALERTVQQQRAELEAHVSALAARTSELETANEAVRNSEARLRALLDQLPAAVWTTDADLIITSVAGGTMGREGLVGRRVGAGDAGLLSGELALSPHREALQGRPAVFEIQRGGRWFQAQVQALRDGTTGAVGVAVDVSDQRRVEEQLRTAQKMEAIGRLAGGVAHDFNNLLSVILSFTALVVEDLPKNAPQRVDLAEVMHAARRGAELTHQLLAFSSRRPTAARVISVADAVTGMTRMLERLLGEDISLELRAEPDLWPTRLDASALEQVVVNLAVNARDAMPRGGRLVIELANAMVDAEWSAVQGESARPGSYVRISVTDTGTGMSPEVQARIFEPFFTTKGVGKGTGLGLATVYGIAQQAGGTVHVYSELGLGTTFQVYFPAAEVGDAANLEPLEAFVPPGGPESILVVEDENQLRALVGRVLTSRGYRVVTAPDANAALKHLEDGPYDLLLTDVVMPGMSGIDLVSRAQQLRPNLRMLLMSGYSPHVVQQRGVVAPSVAMLQKPFTPTGLATAVREVLDRPPHQVAVGKAGPGQANR